MLQQRICDDQLLSILICVCLLVYPAASLSARHVGRNNSNCTKHTNSEFFQIITLCRIALKRALYCIVIKKKIY